MKIKQTTREKYEWYLSCSKTDEPRPIIKIESAPDGVSAIDAFHVMESLGEMLPCREPLILERFIKGKEWHGVTVKMVAEDYIGRLITSLEIKQNYPEWVANEIFRQSEKIAMQTIGFVPRFVSSRADFSEAPIMTLQS